MIKPRWTVNSPTRRQHPVLMALVTLLVACLCCVGALTSMVFDALNDKGRAAPSAFACGGAQPIDLGAKLPDINNLSQDQVHNAAVIISVGQALGIPPRGWV